MTPQMFALSLGLAAMLAAAQVAHSAPQCDSREAVTALLADRYGETRRAFSRTFDYQMYIWAAVLYLVMVEALRNLWVWLEDRLTRHLKRFKRVEARPGTVPIDHMPPRPSRKAGRARRERAR